MDKRIEHLETLGLGLDASWDEVSQAYKDMMRVWHPDRFQADERLRKKAEEQSQRINHAMSELRKLGKEGFERAKRAQPHRSTNNSNTSQKRSERPRQEQAQHTTSHDQHSANFSQTSFSFVIAPLLVKVKVSTALFRIAASLAALYLAYDSLLRSLANPQQEALTVAVIFAALDYGSRNFLQMLIPGPVVAVDKSGLLLHKTGRLNWADFDSVWPLMTPRFKTLSVTFSRRYIDKQNLIMRIFLRLRRWFNPAHVIVPFNGLNASPLEVVNAMKLFQVHQQMVYEDFKPHSSVGLFALQLLAFAACIIPVIRCFREGGLAHNEYLVYATIFLICRLSDFIVRRIRMKF